MIRTLQLLVQLEFASKVFAWNHVSRVEYEASLKDNVALVACKDASKALEPEWLTASKQASKPLLSIDCSAEVDLCIENQVISYPAIRLYEGGGNIMRRYRGPRIAPALTSFLSRSLLPVVSIIDKKNFTAFQSKDEAVFIAFPVTGSEEAMFSSMASLAARNRDRFTFGVASQELVKSQTAHAGCILAYVTENGEPQKLCKEWKLDVLESFVEKATAPLIGEMTRRNELKYLKAGKSLVYVFAKTEAERDSFRSSLRVLAKAYKDYLNFVTVDAIEYAEMAPALGLNGKSFPALVVQNLAMGQVFPYRQSRGITAEYVEQFIQDIAQGRISPGPQAAATEEGHTEL
ncbi:thioredoxin-like domain-containing protein [Bisporella sp. PMI_857]|nr:thioredoxin-like domain-containing protein [Bisporella sp. PMI_857]